MYVDILRINKGGNKLMSVRQLKENKRFHFTKAL